MAHIEFIGKGKVDGQEYNKGNTLDVDEVTKSRLLKEGCIKSDGGTSDCSELQEKLEASINEAQAEVTRLNEELKKALEAKDEILESLSQAEKITDFKAIQKKYENKGE